MDNQIERYPEMPQYQEKFHHSEWRLIQTPAGQGAWNMAVDEAILSEFQSENTLPTLRLYAWEPACISLGFAQPNEDIDWTRATSRGWEVVRRPTGGRAILHVDELTYAVIGPANDERLSGGVLESYRRISVALLAALRLLGLPAEIKQLPGSDSGIKNPVCFEVPSNYEIIVGGKKLVGSAQARRRDMVLQHGTLPLCGNPTRIIESLIFKSERERDIARERLARRATTVEATLGRQVSWEAAAQAFVSAFEQVLNLSLLPDQLNPGEKKRAKELQDEKYSHPSWTARV